jgi:hypothetical protein
MCSLALAGVVAPGALGRAANTALPGGAGAVPAMNAAGAVNPAVGSGVAGAGGADDDFAGDNWFDEGEGGGGIPSNAAIGTGTGTGTGTGIQQPVSAGMNAAQPGVAGATGAANDGFNGDWFAENTADDDNDGLNDQALFGNVLGNTGPTTPTTPVSMNRGANLSGAVGTGGTGTGGTGVGTATAPVGSGMAAPNVGKYITQCRLLPPLLLLLTPLSLFPHLSMHVCVRTTLQLKIRVIQLVLVMLVHRRSMLM